MDARGEYGSSAAFHAWAAGVIERQAERIDEITRELARGATPGANDMLPTRYTLDGEPETIEGEAWPNFQLDGYGTWLFALSVHLGGELSPAFSPAVLLAARYLEACWKLPCYDYWEEFGDRQHTSTLAAIAAGLRAASRLLAEPAFERTAAEIVRFMLDSCVVGGAFVKGPGDSRVDASLVSLSTPFGLFAHNHPVMAATITRVRTELASPSGGIRRYLGDTYYGGNPWLLLTAWLGWHDRRSGNEEGYLRARDWVLAHSGPSGDMAEQILDEPQDSAFVQEWVDRWGPVADPLLWSHAKFVLMESAVGESMWS
jgi:GH15 family glucan-1,4-alpha-glucosidase